MSSFFVFRGEYVWQKEESVSFPDKSQEKYYYNKDLTVSKIEDINGNGDIKNSYSYQYDRNNNIVTQQDKSGITLYKYDALNRISSEYSAEDFIIDYSYDKVGNRISERVSNDKGEYTKKYTYDKENRLTKTEEDNGIDDLVTNYTYDNNGNLLRQKETNISTGEVKEDKELSYDYSNRLIEVKKNGKVKEKNKYDYTGERIEKDTEKGTTKYVYDGTDAIIETDEEGDVSARNYFADTIVSRDTGDKTGYYRYNAEANITEVDSETGDQLASYKYDSFGNIVDECEDFDNPYKYAHRFCKRSFKGICSSKRGYWKCYRWCWKIHR